MTHGPLEISENAAKLQRKSAPLDNFVVGKGGEPHAIRRKQILKENPEVAELYGSDWRQAVFCLFTVILQVVGAYLAKDLSLIPFLAASYVFAGTLNHSLMLALHELSHDHFFEGHLPNLWFSFIANLPIGVAMASTFGRYHRLHHSAMGTSMVDMDLPTHWEAKFFSTALGRLTWLFLQPLFYALRPMVLKPLPVTRWEIINWAMQLTFDGLIVYFWGYKAMLYLLLGTFLGTGIHPMSGHFFEHLETVVGQETYSYYGPLNFLCYNVGYHNEHHDFPRVAGSRLPELKKRLPKWYDLPHYDSWSSLIWNFVFRGNCNLYCRIVRTPKEA